MRFLLDIRLLAFLAAMALGCLTGSGGYTVYRAKGLSYLSDSPTACVNCHVMQEMYDHWQQAAHHTVATCNDCHVPHDLVGKYLAKASNGYHHSVAFTTGDFHEPIQIKPHNRAIVVQNCIRCHGEFVSPLKFTPTHGGGDPDCLHCHASAGHGPAK